MSETDLYAAIKARHGLTLPPGYRALAAAGLFDPFGRADAQRLSRRKRVALMYERARAGQYLYLPNAEWVDPAELLDIVSWPSPATGLLPFAGNGAGDWWGWYTPWATAAVVPVVFYDHEMWQGRGVAADFPAMLFRLLLEGFSEFTDLDFPATDLGALLRTYVAALQPYLPPFAPPILSDLSACPVTLNADGNHALLDEAEVQHLVSAHLAFPHLAQTFRATPG